MKFEWEEIINNSEISNEPFWEATYRAPVIGGWLIKHESAYGLNDPDEFDKRTYTIIFINDPNHEWEIE